jgi:hypothetical protein
MRASSQAVPPAIDRDRVLVQPFQRSPAGSRRTFSVPTLTQSPSLTLFDARAEAREDDQRGFAGARRNGRVVAVEGQGPETSGLGSWEPRGGRSIAGTFLWFLNLGPVQGVDGGRYALVGRVDFKGDFDKTGRTATFPITIGIFSVDQNPLVDAPLFSFQARMIAANVALSCPASLVLEGEPPTDRWVVDDSLEGIAADRSDWRLSRGTRESALVVVRIQ